LATAYQCDPLFAWLFPDPRERARRLPALMRLFVIHAISVGRVDISLSGDAVAVWIDVDATRPTPNLRGVAEVCGHQYLRFRRLDRTLGEHHPIDRAHAYLAFIAVAPHRQRGGLGGALLRPRLAELDAKRMPAYLEATTHRNAALFGRHRFHCLGEHLRLDDAAGRHLVLTPMWREPAVPAPQRRGRLGNNAATDEPSGPPAERRDAS
jgi:GNAT superfamily N-acetyltransferase